MPRRVSKQAQPNHLAELPQVPAVYALYGGRGNNLHIAYVGITGRLRTRIQQHLVNRDSSVSTGTSAAGLNPDYVTELRWWTHRSFKKKVQREAAELVAYDLHEPVLRSRGKHSAQARSLSRRDSFRREMEEALSVRHAAGHLVLPTYQEALAQLAEHEARLKRIEKRLSSPGEPKRPR